MEFRPLTRMVGDLRKRAVAAPLGTCWFTRLRGGEGLPIMVNAPSVPPCRLRSQIMAAKLLPDYLLERWMDMEGKTDREILSLLAGEGIYVTRQALSAWRTRRGAERRRPARPRVIPWHLRPEHRMTEPARAIRAYAQRERGEHLSSEVEERLERVLGHLRRVDGVFHYDPDTEEGWFVVKRREGVDLGIVREPDAPTRA